MRKNHFVDLGKKLKSLRKRNAYSVEDLKNKMLEFDFPIGEKTIYKWENNEVIPELSALKILACIYNISVGSIFEENYSCQPLTSSELSFIDFLRKNESFRKIIYIITKHEKEAMKYANATSN